MRLSSRIQTIASFLAKKTRCNSSIYHLLRGRIYREDIPDCLPLESFWPDKGKSSICLNNININPCYDLQIIVPAYNVGSYVEQCVESILNQRTKYSFCVVIVNDGSTDSTPRILDKYRNLPHVSVIDQENKGLSGARNAGLCYVDAEYVMFVDSDDYLPPDAVEALMDRAKSADADVVDGSFARVDDNGYYSEHLEEDLIDNKFVSGFAWGKVYRSTLFENVHYPEGYWYEDTIGYWIIFPMAKRISTISNIVYYWRRNDKSITSISRSDIKAVDAFWVTRCALSDRKSLGLSFNEYYLEIFLYQVKTNFIRVSNLHRTDIDKSLFVETCQLFNNYFMNIPCDSLPNRDLAIALSNKSYCGYRAFCLFS